MASTFYLPAIKNILNSWKTKAILMERLARDLKVKYGVGEHSTAVVRYTIAVDCRFKRDGEQIADFIGYVAFGRNTEFAEKYLRQGTKMASMMNCRFYKEL